MPDDSRSFLLLSLFCDCLTCSFYRPGEGAGAGEGGVGRLSWGAVVAPAWKGLLPAVGCRARMFTGGFVSGRVPRRLASDASRRTALLPLGNPGGLEMGSGPAAGLRSGWGGSG